MSKKNSNLTLLFTALFFSLSAQASLFDYYGIPNGQTLPTDMQTLIVQQILQQNPFPYTPSEPIIIQYIIQQPDSSFSVNYSTPFGVAFIDKTTLVTNEGLNTWQAWEKDANTWSLGRIRDEGEIITTIMENHITNISGQLQELSHTFFLKKDTSTRILPCGATLTVGPSSSCCSSSKTVKKAHKRVFCLNSMYLNSDKKLYEPSFEGITQIPFEELSMPFIALIDSNDPTTVEIWKKVKNYYWKKVASLKHDQIVYSASFDSNYKQIVTTSKDNQVRIWNLDCLYIYFLADYMPNKRVTLEQLLFLKFLNDVYTAHKQVSLHLAAQLLSSPAVDSKNYLIELLESFGNEIKNHLIKRYNIADTSNFSDYCVIQ